MVETAIKRGWLRRIYAQVTAGTFASLTIALANAENSRIDAVSSGTISSTSGNGHSVSFATQGDSPGQDDFAACISELQDTYDAARAALVAASVSTTDANIYAEMMDRLQPVRVLTKDFSQMRWQA